MSKSMVETAYQVLQKHEGSIPFVQLWTEVSKEMGFTPSQAEDNIAQLYTDLSMDGRFLNMSGNTWDLRSRHTYSESVTDTSEIALDDGDEEDELDSDTDLEDEKKDNGD
ncbi:DNA-directed RNA polymerase subunit delta [uncultured Dubosiella sp.]|uniref:DNA-directed RNA polymerase subunit delta n=1 Tax=uncultured Dubosiella sp. TaxID=1937011 RepID=UPI000EE5BB6B|nr:DNA-directed RNA polymerase subunit delta [uncultured Dubosiella sp.]HAM29799.1 DNA-directed RNA polymerase subunit delta [Erysipelotrichaceae bacterium]